jgi:protein transport protein SEC24
MYLFLLDVSHNAVNTGYLQNACDILLECLDKLPGDTRTQIGFITYNSSIHFYNLSDSLSQPQMLIYPDIDDVILPLPEFLMINLTENKETIQTFLQDLPNLFNNSNDTENALGTALTVAFKLLTGTGGRVTVMQTCLPTCGVGSLKIRSDSIEKDSQSLGPQTDFYKKLALECASVHIAVDLFMFNALYADLATLCKLCLFELLFKG